MLGWCRMNEPSNERPTLTQYRCDEIGLSPIVPHDHDEAGCPRDVWVPEAEVSRLEKQLAGGPGDGLTNYRASGGQTPAPTLGITGPRQGAVPANGEQPA